MLISPRFYLALLSVFIEIFSIFAPVFLCLKLCFRRHCSRLHSNGGEVPSFPECGIHLFLIFTLQLLVLHCLMFHQYWQTSFLILDKYGMLSISQVGSTYTTYAARILLKFSPFRQRIPPKQKRDRCILSAFVVILLFTL